MEISSQFCIKQYNLFFFCIRCTIKKSEKLAFYIVFLLENMTPKIFLKQNIKVLNYKIRAFTRFILCFRFGNKSSDV